MPTVKKVSLEAKLLEKYKIEAKMRDHTVYIDQPETGGGDDSGPTPLEYLFVSLAGCICTIAKIVARQKRIDLRGIEVKIEGDIDVDVLLGRTTEPRAGFTEIRVVTAIDANLTREEKEAFLEEVDRRCPISDNIANISSLKLTVAG